MKQHDDRTLWIIDVPVKVLRPTLYLLNVLKDAGDLIVRLWIAKIFFFSFLTKITDWGATLVLFKYDYSVPLLSPTVAAYIGTSAELILPILLVLGLGGRFFIFAFFVFNAFCVLSFHFLWTAQGAAGLADHINWGLLLMMLMFHGSGRISLDHLLHRRFGHLVAVEGVRSKG